MAPSFSLPLGKLSFSNFVGRHKLKRKSENSKTSRTPRSSCAEITMPALFEDADMLKRWEEATQGQPASSLPMDELKRLVYGGMPAKHRICLWTELALKAKMPPVDICKLQDQASDEAVLRVGQDLSRTLPGCLDDTQILSLQRVLLAYAAWNPAVGYCQGMNFIAAVFINLGFGEAETFAGLSYFIEEICPGCHGPDLSGFHRDAAVLDSLAKRFLPSLHAELAHAGVPMNLLAIDHFISLTSRVWPMEATVRLWDIIVVEGSRAVFASFLALLELFCFPHMAGSRMDMVIADSSPVDNMSAFEIMEFFKRESRRGVASQMEVFFARVRKYVQLMPDGLIDDLRAELSL